MEAEVRFPARRRPLQSLPAHRLCRLRRGQSAVAVRAEGCGYFFNSQQNALCQVCRQSETDMREAAYKTYKGAFCVELPRVWSIPGPGGLSAVQRETHRPVSNVRADAVCSMRCHVAPAQLHPWTCPSPLLPRAKSGMSGMPKAWLQCTTTRTISLCRTLHQTPWQCSIRPCRPVQQEERQGVRHGT